MSSVLLSQQLKLEAKAKRNPIPNPYTQSSSKVGARQAIEPSRAKSSKGKANPQPGSSKR